MFGWCTLPAGGMPTSMPPGNWLWIFGGTEKSPRTSHAGRVQGDRPGLAATGILSTARGMRHPKTLRLGKGAYNLRNLCFKPRYCRGYSGTQRASPSRFRELSLPSHQKECMPKGAAHILLYGSMVMMAPWVQEKARRDGGVRGSGWRADL